MARQRKRDKITFRLGQSNRSCADKDALPEEELGDGDAGSRVEVSEDKEPTSEELGLAILDGINELTARVDETLAKEERCWYELESPHVRNKRSDFSLKSELDILDCVKNREIRELLEVLKEVGSHYADALDKIKGLTEQISELKEQVEQPEQEDDTVVNDDDMELDADMEKNGAVHVKIISLDGSMDELSLLEP